MRETVNVYIRLSKLTLEMVEQQAHEKRISRVAWLRDAILKQLQEDQKRSELEAMEHRLLAKLDVVISTVNAHTTREIDSLVEGADH